ncbi:ABC-F family ATP-binding cassette domain-containing protein [Umezawaea sp. NPDC059074]|uniref:ABC-F family ATP-binding cassette domain-containing protein n=1 Tax=Umezawaea sp. NPDC059074 TaxID=3346716 RepID=UPI00369D00C1
MRSDPDTGAKEVFARDLRSAHLLVESVHCTLGDREVLRDISLTVARGERIGLIGENGRGKSTLLRVLAGDLPAQRGEVVRAVSGRVGFLPQRPDFPLGATVADVVAEANSATAALAARLHAAEEAMASDHDDMAGLLAEYGDVQEEFGRRGGYEVEARTGETLDVFGLGGVDQSRPTSTLSGGERARLALAALVLTEPAGLLLDEPTNHLDDRALEWLVRWLSDYGGPCLIASHDRVLLDTAVTAIVDLDGPRGEAVRHGGNYRDYLGEQTAARERWTQRYRDWLAEVGQTRDRLAKAGTAGGGGRGPRDNNKLAYNAAGSAAEAAVARAAKAAQRRLATLLEERVPRPPEPLRFAVDLDDAPEGTLLAVADVAVGDVLRGVDLDLSHGSKVVVVGPNGAGKSTLLAVLAGDLVPDRGVVTRAPGVRVGHLPQEVDFAAEDRDLLTAFTARRATYREDAARELTRFGLFHRRDFAVPVNRLSVGQQRRFALALVFAAKPHVLLLDEPTNHLSLLLVEQLERAVEEFPGPVVTVTHDRTLRDRHPGRVHHLVDGGLSAPEDRS